MQKNKIFLFQTLLLFITIFLPVKNIFSQDYDSLKKDVRLSLGVGIASYDKDGLAYSLDFLGQTSKSSYICVSLDNFVLMKLGSSNKNLRSVSANLLSI